MEELKEQWTYHLGRAILAFCNIEYVTYELLEQLPTEPIVKSAPQSVSARINLIKEILERKDVNDNWRAEFHELLSCSNRLCEMRNIIVHNPLHIGVGLDDSGNVLLEPVVRKTRKSSPIIDLKKLIDIANEAETLSTKLWGKCLGLDRQIGGATQG